MHNSKFYILALLFVSCFFSCNMSDSIEDLSGGYQFAHEGKGYNSISNNYNSIPANVTGYNFNDNFIIIEQEPNRQDYKSNIGYDLSAKYIMYYNEIHGDTTLGEQSSGKTEEAIRKDTTLYRILRQKGMSPNNTAEDIKIGWAVADSILNTDSRYIKLFSMEHAYWIITLNNDELIGPLTKEEYQQKRKALDIPESLQIRPADN